VLFGAIVSLLPWPLGIEMPARMEATRASVLFAATPAQLIELRVEDGASVKAGDTLMVLAAPDLDHRMAQARTRITIAQLTIQRQAARPEGVARMGIVEEELAADLATWRGLDQQARRLTITAPHDGVVRDLARALHPGRWIGADLLLARVVSGPARIEGYVEAQDVARIAVGAHGRFIPDDPARAPHAVIINRIEPAAAGSLTIEALASTHGGPIAVNRDPDGRLIPLRAIWGVGLALTASDGAAPAPHRETVPHSASIDGGNEPTQITVAGKVKLSIAGEAPLTRLWRAAIGLVIRESGF